MVRSAFLFFPLALGLLAAPAAAQSPSTAVPVGRDSLTQKGYTLVFINQDPALSATTKQRMVDAFYKVYPQEAKRFNPQTRRKVTFFSTPPTPAWRLLTMAWSTTTPSGCATTPRTSTW